LSTCRSVVIGVVHPGSRGFRGKGMLGGKLGAAEPGCYFSFRTPLCCRGLPLRMRLPR
jgi:hypothetical protein